MTRYRSGEALVFGVATLLVLLHALEDAFLHRGPGVGMGQHALAAAVSIAVAVAGALAFPSLRPGLRAGIAFAFGGLAIVNGALHIRHMAEHGVVAGHVSGAVAAAAGVVLVALAVAIPLRHRGEGAATARRRWANRVVAVPVAFVAVLFVLGPIGVGIVDSHKFRGPVGAPPAGYEPVGFEAGDGVDLAGWYRPTRNGATVLVLHGGGSDRAGVRAHAELLARHGYGVLLYDARGGGESEGSQNSYGWGWEQDVAGALDFLKQRPEVDPQQIGAFGLSTGADVLLDVAAGRTDLSAVVGDGAAAGSFEDWHRLRGADLGLPPGWIVFKTIEVLTGSSPGPALEDRVARIASPVLLISAGTDAERDFNVLYEAAAPGSVEHWNLPDAHHTDAIHDHADEYERRVAAFFDGALLRGR